jgi:methylated-DNA-[protein]-cysteine S-methyltransferase
MKYVFYYDTILGKVGIVEEDGYLTSLHFDEVLEGIEVKENAFIKKVFQTLDDYLSGKRINIDFKMKPKGTPFQEKVWDALKEIPYGETRSYKDIAFRIGKEKACRAVGGAINKNPIPIFIPCHRVIGSNGSLVGFALGLKMKQQLLDIEK